MTNDDQLSRNFNAPPVIVNYFYHEQIKKSTRKDACSAPIGAERRGENHKKSDRAADTGAYD